MQAQPSSDLFLVMIGIFASLILFLIFREVVCWYFKLSKISKQLDDIKNILQEVLENEPEKDQAK